MNNNIKRLGTHQGKYPGNEHVQAPPPVTCTGLITCTGLVSRHMYWDMYRPRHMYWDMYRPRHMYWDMYRPRHMYWDMYRPHHMCWDMYRPRHMCWDMYRSRHLKCFKAILSCLQDKWRKCCFCISSSEQQQQ